MTGKQTVYDAVAFKPTGRTAVGVIDGQGWLFKNAGICVGDMLEKQDFGASYILEHYRRFDSDIIWPASAFYNMAVRALGGDVDISTKGSCPEVVRPLWNSAEDCRDIPVKSIRERLLADDAIRGALRQTEICAAEMGTERCVMINALGPISYAAQLIGMTEFMMALFSEEDDARRLIDFTRALTVEHAKLFLEAGADSVFIGEPTASGDLISQAMFEEFALPALKGVCGELSGCAGIILLHICGDSKSRIASLVGSGISAFSLDSIDISEAMRDAAGDFAIMGNIPTISVLNDMSPEGVYTACSQVARQGGNEGGFVLMSGCDIPPSAPAENITAFIDAAKDNVSLKP